MTKKIKLIISLVIAGLVMTKTSLPVFAEQTSLTMDSDYKLYCSDVEIEDTYITDEQVEVEINRIKKDTENAVYEYSVLYNGFDSNEFGCDFYYNQLNSAQKETYDSLVEESEKVLASNTNYTGQTFATIYHSITIPELKETFRAFYYDNPQFFFLKQAYSYSSYVIMPVINEDFWPAKTRNSYAETISNVADSWILQIEEGKNDLEKEEILYTLMCDKITYGFSSKDQSMAGALVDEVCVCNGYAMTFTYFANAVGLDTVAVIGIDHAWNAVKLFGDWYNIDVTWMDQESFIWKKYLNISTSDMLSYDIEEDTNSHTLTEYESISYPLCVKSNPSVPVAIKPVATATAGTNQVTLKWNAVTGATNYAVSIYENGKYNTLTRNCTATTYTVTNLTGGKEYTFLVQAYINGAWTKFTSADFVKATPTGVTTSTKPVATATAGANQVTLKWNAVTGATNYAVSIYENGKYNTLTRNCTATTYTVTNLTGGKEYTFLVQAYINGAWTKFTSADFVKATPVD